MLMNDTFDALNGRFYAEGISNKIDPRDSKNRTFKELKWSKLKAMLNVLDITETEHKNREKNSSSPIFCSLTTLKALRITINSAIALTEELLENGYHTALTGEMNQDPIKVIVVCIIKLITLTSSRGYLELQDQSITRQLPIHGYISLEFYPCITLTKSSVSGGNVDNEDELQVLVKYKKCLVDRFKDIEEGRKQAKLSLKDQLLTELSIRYLDQIDKDESSYKTDDGHGRRYDICGYLLHSRCEVLECPKCKSLLKTEESELPESFSPANNTLTRTYGYLKLASVQMFECFKKVESLVAKHFSSDDHIYIRDAFEQVINQIGSLHLVPLSCDEHPDVLPFLMMEYVQIRFYFESKRYRDLNLSKTKTAVHTGNKLAKTA